MVFSMHFFDDFPQCQKTGRFSQIFRVSGCQLCPGLALHARHFSPQCQGTIWQWRLHCGGRYSSTIGAVYIGYYMLPRSTARRRTTHLVKCRCKRSLSTQLRVFVCARRGGKVVCKGELLRAGPIVNRRTDHTLAALPASCGVDKWCTVRWSPYTPTMHNIGPPYCTR